MNLEGFEHWLEVSEKLRNRTIIEYIRVLKRFEKDIDLNNLEKTNNKINSMTVHKSIKLMLTAALRKYLVFDGKANYITKIDKPEYVQGQAKKFIDENIVWKVAGAAKTTGDKLLYPLTFYGALRAEELLSIRKDNGINLERSTITIEGKGGKVRTIMFTNATKKLLLNHIRKVKRGERLFNYSYWTLRKKVKELARNAKLKKIPDWITPHVLRHTWGAEARKKGLDLSYRSMYMGHSRADTTRKFYDWISTKEEMMKFKEAFPG